MTNWSVVITGGAGFIGSNLSGELANNNTVVIIDNLSTGNKENIANIVNKDNVNFIQGDIMDLQLLKKTFRNVDYVFHQAAIPSVTRSIEDPISTNQVNITGTLNVLIAARDNYVKKVIFASSSSIYGDTPSLPKLEDMNPNPQSPYALTKYVGEYYCQIFSRIFQLPTISLRYFNVYGPRQNPNSEYAAVIPLFITNIQQGKQPIIYGDGNQTRDFTYVQDVVQANILAAESDNQGSYNVGEGEKYSINQVMKLIQKLLKKKITAVYLEPRPGDIKHSLADIQKAKSFGYMPKYPLDTGLRETINYFSSCTTGH